MCMLATGITQKELLWLLNRRLPVGLSAKLNLRDKKRFLRKLRWWRSAMGRPARNILRRIGAISNKVAERLLELIKQGKKGLNILNAKKETAFMFADINLAVAQVAEKLGFGSNIVNM